MELGQSLVVAEPVERLADRDAVDARVGQRDRLGRTEQRLGLGHGSAQLRQHLLAGLHGDHPCACGHERARQLAGAGAEVEHGSAGAKVELSDDPRDRLVWVFGPRALVEIGDQLERS